MMRVAFTVGTGLFCVVVLLVWLFSPPPSPTIEAPQPILPASRIPLAEVSRHGQADDCWMAIDGKVYDLTPYLPLHPTKPGIIVPWCGQEASEAYRTKTRGRPHSAEAGELLEKYLIGQLAE